MRNLKKILSLALALVMVLSMMVTASAAFEDQDLINEKYAEAVEVMAELDILQGNGTDFDPAGTLTRAQAAVILSKVVSGKSDVKFFEGEAAYVENPFSDVPAWAVPFVLYCYQNEIVGGIGGDKFNAMGTLRGYDFAKMLLIAAGYGVHEDYIGDASKTYETKVLEAAKKADLLAGLTITLSKNITREQAAQMALNAMKAGGETTVTYYVVVAGTTLETMNELNTVAAYNDILTAHQLKAAMGDGYAVLVDTKSAGSLLADVWGVTYKAGNKDEYGRKADVYTFPAVLNVSPAYNLYFNTPDTLVTYTNAITEADVKALSDAKIKVATGNAYKYVDGVYTVGNDVKTLKGLVGLGGPNSVVEVYAEKGYITNVVVVNTHIDTIEAADITPAVAATATPEKVKVGGITVNNTYGLKAGDVVSYTKYGTTLDTVTKLEGTTAKVAGISKFGGIETYTINNAYYTLDCEKATLIKNSMATGDELVYYFGANNTIVWVASIVEAETPAVVYNNFAYVLKTVVKATGTSANLWGSDVTSYSAAAKLLGADGKVTEVAITINYAASATKVGGVSVTAGSYYYVIDGKPVVLTEADFNAGKLTALDEKVVAFEGGAITFASQTLEAETSGNIYTVIPDTVASNKAVVLGGVLVNSNTSIVVAKNNKLNSYTAVKGQAALAGDVDGVVTKAIVYSANWVPATATTAGYYTYTALVVFAHGDYINAVEAPAEDADYVMYTGFSNLEYDADEKAYVYAHTMMKADGSYVIVKLPVNVELKNYHIYQLMTDGELKTEGEGEAMVAVSTKTFGVVAAISDNFVLVYEYNYTTEKYDTAVWLQVGEKTVAYGELTVGCNIFWNGTNGTTDMVIDTMFLFPAEA